MALPPTTALQGAAMEAAIGRGDRWVNFSPGPNESKLRWSEDVHLFDDFGYGVDDRGTLARYTLFSVAKDVRELRHVRAQALGEAATPAAAGVPRRRRPGRPTAAPAAPPAAPAVPPAAPAEPLVTPPPGPPAPAAAGARETAARAGADTPR